MKAFKLFTLAIIVVILGNINAVAQEVKVEVVDFHSTNRCMSCNMIEANALQTVKTHFPENENVTFAVFNLDKEENKAIAKEFKATGTSLFIRVTKDGKSEIINMTQFAFMNVRNKDKFIAGLKEEIEKHL